MAGGISLAPLKTRIEVDIKSFKDQMSQAATEGVSKAREMSKQMSTAANVGKVMEKAGASMTKAFTVPLAGAGVACTKFYITAEDSFAKVNTIIDQTKVSNEELHESVKEASNDTGVAIEEFNEALYSSISAGVDSGKAIEFTTNMTKLAKGGFTSTESAVNVVTTALNAYGLGADEAAAVSDKLITTQNLGKTTVDALASSMGKVIPTANAYGVNLDNVCASLADLTKNGIDTAEATTYYNSMLNELGSSGTTASKIIKEELGASFTDLMNQGVPLTDVLKVLKDSAEESGMSLGDMFGSSEAAKAALTIMKDDGEEYNEILKQMENSAGATDAAFQEMDSTPLNELKKALNELKNVAIDFGSQMAPAIDMVTDALKWLADSFSSLTPEQQQFIIKAVLVVAALGPVLSIVGKGIETFTMLRTVLAAAGAGSGIFQAAIGLLTGPVGIAVVSIGGLIAAGVALYQNWDKVKETASQVKERVVEAWDGLKQSTSEAWQNIKQTVSEKWEGLKSDATSAADDIKTSVGEKFDETKESMSSVMQSAKDNIAQHWADIQVSYDEGGGGISGITEVWFDQVNNTVTSTLDKVSSVTGTDLSGVSETFTTKWLSCRNTVTDSMYGIQSKIQSSLSSAKSTVSQSMNNIQSSFRNGLSGAKSTALSVFDSIKSGISDRINGARDKVQQAIEKIKGFFNFSWSLPHLKMPHPYISGKFSLNPPQVPSFGINWYKKAMEQAMLLSGPTIFGINGSGFLGGGEAGDEMVIGKDHMMNMISAASARDTIGIMNQLNTVISMLSQYFPAMIDGMNVEIMLDGDILVGRLVRRMDTKLGELNRQHARGL